MEPVNIAIDSGAGGLPPLRLRPPRAGDLGAVSRMFNDPQTAKWSLVPRPFTAEHAARFLEIAARDWSRSSPRWLVCGNADDDVLGTVALRRHPRQTWEVVFHTAPWARRGKVALRAVHAAARFGLDTLGAARLEWNAIVGNHLSRLIALRLGFRMEGLARAVAEQRGERVDQWVGALLPGELRDVDTPPDGYELHRLRARVFCESQPVLDTGLAGVRLRPVRRSDVDDITAACRDPEMARWTTVPQPYEREHAVGFVDEFAGGGWRGGTMMVSAIADAQDRYCGAVDLRLNHSDPRVAEIGYGSAPWSRGRGYMTAAVETLCEFGFTSLGLERIEWKAYQGNEASRRVAVKAGFTMEGDARGDVLARGERVDSWLGAILKGDR